MKIFFKILSWRLRFYANSTFDALGRRNQAILTIGLLLGPAFIPILITISSYVLNLTMQGSIVKSIITWVFILFLFVGLVIKQRNLLLGGEFRNFINIQPYHKYIKHAIDFILLMVVDLFAIFPFCIAIAYVVYDEVYSPYSFYQIILILLMLLHLVLLQVIALYKKKYLFIFMMLSIISKVFVSVFGLYFWAIAIDSLLVVLLMMAIGFGSDAEIRKSEIPKFLLVRINNKFFINLVLIEIRYLCSRDQLFNIFALIVFGAFIFGAFFIHHRMEWSYFLIKSICIAILFLQLFVVGSMEFALKNLNMKMLDYWRGYGVSHRFIYCSQLLSVLFIGILSFIPLIVVVFLLSSLFSAFSLFWIVLAGIALISYLNMKSESVHFIVKVILVASVCFCAWDII